jgi:hypothetical protein
VTVSGRRITGALDGKRMLDYEADRPVQGYVGLWARADSVSRFQGLEIEPAPAGTDRGGGNGAAQ